MLTELKSCKPNQLTKLFLMKVLMEVTLTLFTKGFFGLCRHEGRIQSALPPRQNLQNKKRSIDETCITEVCILCLHCLPVFVFRLRHVM